MGPARGMHVPSGHQGKKKKVCVCGWEREREREREIGSEPSRVLEDMEKTEFDGKKHPVRERAAELCPVLTEEKTKRKAD